MTTSPSYTPGLDLLDHPAFEQLPSLRALADTSPTDGLEVFKGVCWHLLDQMELIFKAQRLDPQAQLERLVEPTEDVVGAARTRKGKGKAPPPPSTPKPAPKPP